MRRFLTIVAGVVVVLAPAGRGLQARQQEGQPQQQQQQQEQKSTSEYQQKFDASRMKTFRGEVVSMDERALDGEGRGRTITLRTEDGERIDVHLAPNWFMENQRLRIEEGDRIEVRAAQASGEDYYMAASIAKDGVTLRLRDNMGNPYWACGPTAMLAGEAAMTPRLGEERARSREMWSRDGAYGRNFNPEDVRTYEGEIVAIDSFRPMAMGGRMAARAGEAREQVERRGEERRQRQASEMPLAAGHDRGVMVTLGTEDQGEIRVHLGPAWFMDNLDVELREGERLTVVGSKATWEGQDVVIASRITIQDHEVNLRDEQGYPYWAARPRGMGRGRY